MKTIYIIDYSYYNASVAENLPRPAKLYTSEQPEPMQTAQAICDKWHVRPEPLPCMTESESVGVMENESVLAPPMMMGLAQAAVRVDDSVRNQSAQQLDELYQNVAHFLKIAPKFPHRTMCVAHGNWLDVLLWQVLGFHAPADKNQIQQFYAWQKSTPNHAMWFLHIGDSWETWMQVADLNG